MRRRRVVNWRNVAESDEHSKLDGDDKNSKADSVNIHKKRTRRKNSDN